MNRTTLISLQVFAILGVSLAGYTLGVRQTVARSAYVQSIPIQEEAKCITTQYINCLRTHWIMRASINAESARRSLDSWLPAPMNSELARFVTWVQAQSIISGAGIVR